MNTKVRCKSRIHYINPKLLDFSQDISSKNTGISWQNRFLCIVNQYRNIFKREGPESEIDKYYKKEYSKYSKEKGNYRKYHSVSRFQKINLDYFWHKKPVITDLSRKIYKVNRMNKTEDCGGILGIIPINHNENDKENYNERKNFRTPLKGLNWMGNSV